MVAGLERQTEREKQQTERQTERERHSSERERESLFGGFYTKQIIFSFFFSFFFLSFFFLLSFPFFSFGAYQMDCFRTNPMP